jgi:hypothetical protein
MRKTQAYLVRGILIPVLLLAVAGMTPLFAIDVTFFPPKFGGSPSAIIDPINGQLESIFAQYENEVGKTLQYININTEKLVSAFATSSVFASTGATQRGYGGYNAFAVTLGAMGGIMLPINPFSLLGEINSILDNVEKLDDISFGFNPQVLNAQIGLNTSFLLDRLYLGLKLGYFNLGTGPITFTTPSIGVMANYQLIPQIRIPLGIVVWRGINLGTGLIYQNTKMGIGIPLPSQNYSINLYELSVSMIGIDPELTTDFDIETMIRVESELILEFVKSTLTIPLEAVTSLRLLGFLNLSFGLGADLGFGSADFKLTGNATASIEGLPGFLNPIENAGLSASIDGTNSPDFFNPKLMAGLGFSLGPVIIDVPFTIYPVNNGYNFGITLGFVL